MKRILFIALLLISLSLAACTQPSLKDKKILIVIAPQNFRDEEFTVPKAAFERLGAKVEVASTRLGTAKGMLGLEAKVDLLIANANPNDYSAIVITGGIGSKEYLWGDENLGELVRQFQYRNKVVAAICLSPVVLAKAGLLNGREATVYPDSEAVEILRDNGAIYMDKKVVISDKIITARDPESAGDFASVIINLLSAS
ncbi:MAG: DJ-1/PfpI family protein [Methanocellales archaeon]